MGIPDGGDYMTNLFRLSGDRKATIYGGTFVDWNPNVGDKMGNGFFLDGQTTAGVTPDGYTITESTTAEGKTAYTVEYNG